LGGVGRRSGGEVEPAHRTHRGPREAEHLLHGFGDDLLRHVHEVERWRAVLLAAVEQRVDAISRLEVGPDHDGGDGVAILLVLLIDVRTYLEQVLGPEVTKVVKRHDLGAGRRLAELASRDELADGCADHFLIDVVSVGHVIDALWKSDEALAK